MFGAILGDIIGSPYEFDRGNKTKDIPLFSSHSTYTDDSIMTVAVGASLMDVQNIEDEEIIRQHLSQTMRAFGEMFPFAGYGLNFSRWLRDSQMQAYGSYGNGSAMRVSPVAWLYDDLESVRYVARLSAEVTHNHPEGIKGAESVASAIYLARSGKNKMEIKSYIVENFGYNLSRTCDEIRPNYRHVESCMESVPEAITAFFEGESFEDVIRTAVSLGGDTDTVAAIAGSIAEGYYGVPKELKQEVYHRLPESLLDVLKRYEEKIQGKI